MATPTEDATRRCGSFVALRAITTNVISPGWIIFKPFSRVTSLHPGGTMLETLTRFAICIPASRKANSNDWSCSLCLPTPFVKKKYFGIMCLSENMDYRLDLLVFCFKSPVVLFIL